ncbi:MAG: hypothetical protein GY793_01930 [Proteobacteria bacterium]|nr:hypothetical protein [Pseudomonadota bacterium]
MSVWTITRFVERTEVGHVFFVVYRDGKAVRRGGLTSVGGNVAIENYDLSNSHEWMKGTYDPIKTYNIPESNALGLLDRLDKDQADAKANPRPYNKYTDNCAGYERELLGGFVPSDIPPIHDDFYDKYPGAFWAPYSISWSEYYGGFDYGAYKASKLGDELGGFLDAAARRIDPLVLDLDGDGLELNSMDSGIRFDMDNDGFAENTSWVKADDGLLVMDKNGNGTIDNITELFGSATKTGFEELAELDSNSDGTIDANDTDFGNIKVWQDLNQNGISEADELKTLSEAGISSISLTEQQDGSMVEDAILVATGEATKTDGSTIDVGEFNFNISDSDTVYVGDGSTELKPTIESMALPLARGYGNVLDLSIAVSYDEVLCRN